MSVELLCVSEMKFNMFVILALGSLALAQFGETGRRIVKYPWQSKRDPWHNKLTIPDRATSMVNIQKVVQL